MINITYKDIEELKPINDGAFGVVYQKDDDTCYKIYRSRISNIMGILYDNPSLSVPMEKLERLKQRASSLKYTSSIQDYIYINGKFGGVSIPFYDGKLLKEFISSDFKLKVDLSNQLIRNHKELTHHLIFPIDYKLNNVMVVNDEIKIIDLDDVLTWVPKVYLPHHSIGSNVSLSKCVSSLFGGSRRLPFSHSVIKSLDKNNKIRRTSSLLSLKKQIFLKEKAHHFSLITKDDDFSDIKKDDSNKYLFLYDKNMRSDDILNVINKLKEKNINLFDLLDRVDLDNYFTNFNTDICSDINGNIIYQKGR